MIQTHEVPSVVEITAESGPLNNANTLCCPIVTLKLPGGGQNQARGWTQLYRVFCVGTSVFLLIIRPHGSSGPHVGSVSSTTCRHAATCTMRIRLNWSSYHNTHTHSPQHPRTQLQNTQCLLGEYWARKA